MRVIPVIDLKGGAVVHARGGVRAAYRAIESPLAPGSSDPIAVVGGYLNVFPFETVYIADLDGIAGLGRNHDTICALRVEFPAITFWVDDGSASPASVAALARMSNVRPVVGSETLRSIEILAAICEEVPRTILSLDGKGSVVIGPEALPHAPDSWPDTVIAMALANVGTGAGPDLVQLRQLKAAKPGAKIIAAGGVRDRADLVALRAAGAAGVLVASALHAGTIRAGDLEEFAGP